MEANKAPGGRAAGIVFAVCAALSIIAIAYHPTAAARSPVELMSEIVQLGLLDRIVHGAFIVVLGGLTFGASVFAARQGFYHVLVLAGFIAFVFGVDAAMGAAVLDGFLIPDIALRYVGGSPEQINIAGQLLTMYGLTIQILGKLSVVAGSLGILMWSVRLIGTPGVLRAAGIIGVGSGILPVLLSASGVRLTPHSLSAVIIVQAIWYFAIAALLIRGRL